MNDRTITVEINGESKLYISGLSIKGIGKNENQDEFLIGCEKESAFIAVADGLGSCKNSKEGAKLATRLVGEWVRNDLPQYEKLSESVASIFNKKLIQRWRNELKGKMIHEYDTTIHYTIYYKNNVLVGGIGDGMAVATIDEIEGHDFISPKEYFGNVTNSIGSEDVIELIEDTIIDVSNFKNKIVLVLATDGISEDIIPEKKYILPNYFYETVQKCGIEEMQNEIKEWLNNWEIPGYSDDKTIAIMIIEKIGDN